MIVTRWSSCTARALVASAVLVLAARDAAAQGATPGAGAGPAPRVLVRDSIGRAIPWASVQTRGTNPRVASDSGVATLTVARADSLRLIARRIGFEPFEGWIKPDAAGDYTVYLRPLPQNIDRVTIYERDTPLARTGFYDRMERVQRGAISARFWTPEQIDLRNPSRLSSLFEGENIVRVRPTHGKPVLMGRGGSCPMSVIVDGQRMRGMVEEMATPDGQDEIEQMKRRGMSAEAAERTFIGSRTSVDELINSLGVVAVEIYASLAAAPAEMQRNAAPATCGLVAIWTGRRS